jgi:hypothetical protein
MITSTYSIHLTFDEIQWLGQIFNIIEYPILPRMNEGSFNQQPHTTFNDCQKSLEGKGLVKFVGRNQFAVEMLAKLIVDCLSEPDLIIKYDSLIIHNSINSALGYFKGNKILKLINDKDGFLIEFFASVDDLIEQNLDQGYFSKKESLTSVGFTLLTENTLEFLKLIHSDYGKAIKALQINGISETQAKETINHLSKIRFGLHLLLIECMDGEYEPGNSIFLLVENNAAWLGKSNKGEKLTEMVQAIEPQELMKVLHAEINKITPRLNV